MVHSGRKMGQGTAMGKNLGQLSWSTIKKKTKQKTVVHLHSGMLPRRKKQGSSTLCGSIDGTGDLLAK